MANNLTNTDISRYLGLTDADVTALQTAQGDEFQVVKNKFLNAILNKIAYQKVENMKWSTPFEELRGYPIKYGDTIENIFIDVPAGYDYDMHATNPFDTATNSNVGIFPAENSFSCFTCFPFSSVTAIVKVFTPPIKFIVSVTFFLFFPSIIVSSSSFHLYATVFIPLI